MTPKLVLTIEPSSASDIRAMDAHERIRTPDGTSAIDKTRSHLNRVLRGTPEGPQAALTALYKSGAVARPAAQAERPFLRIVLSVSASFFRPDTPEAIGTYEDARLTLWEETAIQWLNDEVGADLAHASIHLDEDTPHIHALFVPTYMKAEPIPGKRKKEETEDAFEARRKEVAEKPRIRTVGRASHPYWRKANSFTVFRKSFAKALAPLGIVYGDNRTPDAPARTSGREWVRQQTVELRRGREALAKERAVLDSERTQIRARSDRLATRDAQLRARAEDLAAREAWLATEARTIEKNKRVYADQEARLAEDRRKVQKIFRSLQGAIIRIGRLLGVTPDLQAIARQLADLEHEKIVYSSPPDRDEVAGPDM